MKISEFVPGLDDRVRQWTFPAYRQLLNLQPNVRYPTRGAGRSIQPIAFVAAEHGEICGLALACVPIQDPEVKIRKEPAPELLSLYVAPSVQRRGVANMLMEAIENAIHELGFGKIETAYMAGIRNSEYVERLLTRRQWSVPKTNLLVFKFSLRTVMESLPWLGRYTRGNRFEFFPWAEMTEADIERLKASNRATAWIPESVQPWDVFDLPAIEQASSIGVRYDGEVVGWVITHQLDNDTIRFTRSFIRRDFARRARIVPAWHESMRLADKAGFQRGVFAVSTEDQIILQFAMRRFHQVAEFEGETRHSFKALR
jgi:GNAT superfamily N-acetyltransferase